MKPIIRVQNLSKQYTIGTRQATYGTLRDSLAGWLRNPFRRNGASEDNTIWALRDVSFDVMPGEVVGIIGRNGAGKSTLLKILSRIVEPTTGKVDLYGRVGSLLEVGTGFHGELSGRENIYLNGAILGMKRTEIDRKFDEIVDFAEIEKFIDTPVKHYSSGMYMRLAFAVAAHLEPEILIVDEVLAVGDAAFQNKCLGKMEQIGAQGRTVLFVSHNTQMIFRLCGRVLYLDRGGVKADGNPQVASKQYLQPGGNPAERFWGNVGDSPGDSVARLLSVKVTNDQGDTTHVVDVKESFRIEVEYLNFQTQVRPTAILHFVNEAGMCLFATNEFNHPEWKKRILSPGKVTAICQVPANLLAEGKISILVAVGSYNPNVVHAIERDAISFQVVDRARGEGARGEHVGDWPGVMRPKLDWTVRYCEETHKNAA